MRKFRLSRLVGFLVSALFYLAPTSGNAQTNIAPLATASASVCNTGACSTLNDLNLGTCGTQQMWISTATPPSTTPGVDWIEWVFPSARTFDSLVIHHGQASGRFLTGATVENWNGVAWVTHSTFSGLTEQCINRVGIGKLTSARFRITAFIPGTGQLSNLNFREIEILEASNGFNDAAIASVDSPGVYCSGVQPVVATVANYGLNQIDSVDVTWEVNGVVQGTIKVVTLLDTLNGFGSNSIQVPLGSFTFPQGLNDLRIWTSMPNGVLDTSNVNDTASVKTGPALNGIFTIDASAAASATNYTSFGSLSTALNTFGVCGPVTVNVAAGTYNETFELSNIIGASSVNTITIDGGDSSTTTLSHDNTSNYGTVTIVGTDYVTIRNMRIEATALNGASILINNSSHNTFESNILWANPNSTSTNTNFIISGTTTSISTNGAGSYNTLQNNLMIGGYYSVYIYGAAATRNVGNVIHNNEMDSVYYYGSYIFYQDSLEFTNNTLDQATRGQINGDGLYLYYSSNYDVSGNYIHAADYGIYFYNFNAAVNAPTLNGKNRVSNNMIISDTDWGIYFLYETEVDFFHNSIATYGTVNPAVQITANATNIIDNYDVRNNVFYSASTEAFELTGIVDTIFTKMDNNVYYTGGSNLLNINATTYTDLLSYQTAQPAYNASSLDGDPQFLSTTDLHIIGAFINGAGDNSVPVSVDIDGDTRPLAGSTVVDPGADEFNPPTCQPAANLGATNGTLTSVDIFWDGVAMDYQYEVVLAGAGQGTGTVVATLLDSVTVTGLTASTSYDFYVREVCGRGDTSLWQGPLTFSTSNGLPYFEDFETFPNAISANPWPKGWTSTTNANPNWISAIGDGAVNSSTGTGPFVDHTLNGAPNGIYIYMETSGGTVGALADFVSPPVFIDPSVTTFEASYWYFMYGAQVDSMEVFILSNNVYTLLATYIGQQQTAHTDAWLQGKHAITGFGGQSVQLVFRGSNPPCCAGDIGVDDVKMDILPPNSAGVTEVVSPQLPICPGTFAPVVAVGNSGTDTLTTVTVVWDVNGVKDSVLYTGSILPGDTAHVTLGNVTFANGFFYDFTIYTNFPNGLADANNNDDTLSFAGLRTGLSGNFTIDSTSSVSATNFLSFEDFADAVNDFGLCGALTVAVTPLSGPYNDQLVIADVAGASATNTITINGNGAVLASNISDANARGAIIIDNTPWVTIDSLNVDAIAGTYGYGVHILGNSSNCSVLNSTIDVGQNATSTNKIPVVISGTRTSYASGFTGSNVTVDNCELVGGYFSLTSYGTSAAAPLVGNTFSNNIHTDFYLYGIYTVSNDSMSILNNDLSRATRGTVSTLYGIYMSTPTNTVVNANAIHNTGGTSASASYTAYPIYLTGDAPLGSENYITNNLIYNINTNGTTYAIYDLGSDGAYYYNNTISLDDAAATGGITRGFYQSALSSNSAFSNNIISITKGGSGIKHGIYLNATTTTMSVDYNDVYMNSAGTGTQSYGYYGADQVDLLAWQTATTTYGANSYEVDPRFTNLLTDDLTPRQALINAVALSVPQVTTDFFGNPWGANPDMGGIEFTPAPIDNVGLNALIAPIESPDTCYGATNDVIVELLNAGGTVIDFTNSTTVITMNVSGATTQTLTATVNTNAVNGGVPLAIGASVNVNIGTINMTTLGTYVFDGYIATVNDSLRANDTLATTVTVQAPVGGVINGSDTVCSGDNVALSVSGFIGDIQWQELVAGTFVDITGETAPTYDAVVNSSSTFRVVACGVAFSDTLNVFPIVVSAPTVVKNDPVIVSCGQTATDTLIMAGAAGSTLEWFDAPTGGNSVNNGDTLLYIHNTATSNASIDTFYVEASTGVSADTIDAAPFVGGNGCAGGNMFDILPKTNVDINGLAINTNDVLGTLMNVDIYTKVGTYQGSQLIAANWTLVGTATGVSAGPNQPTELVLATPISLSANSLTGMFVAFNAAYSNLPIGTTYSTPSMDIILGDGLCGLFTGNNPGRGFNGRLYYGGGCQSSRTMVIGEVNCAVGIDALSAETAAVSIYPNPSNGLFTLNIETPAKENFNMTVRDAQGRTVFTENVTVNGTYRNDLDFTSFAKGVYYMQIQTENGSTVEKLIIQ